MIVATLAILSQSVFSFNGGPLEALVQQAATAKSSPVVLFVDEPTTVRKFDFRWADETDFNRLLSAKLSLSSHKTIPAYFPRAYPEYMISRAMVLHSRPDPRFRAFKLDSWADVLDRGVVATQKPMYLRIGDLNELPLEKPVHVHWFLSNAAILYSGKATLHEVLTLVAHSTGATLRNDPKGYFLDPIPQQYRDRMLRRLSMKEQSALLAGNKYELASSKMARLMLTTASDDVLRRALHSEDRSITMTPPRGSALYQAALDRAKAWASRDVQVQPGQYTPEQILAMLDTQRPIEMSVHLGMVTTGIEGYQRNRQDGSRIGF
jgi:hypothetical protein